MADDEAPKSLRQLARGFRKRTLTTAKLATKVGFKAVQRQLGGAREPSPSADEGTEADLAHAHELAEELGALKGLLMKFGQMASYMPGALPPKAQRVLSQLQANTVAMQWQTVGAALEEQLGDRAEALFDSIEHEPFAAASIGQVHRARLDGADVAVKIQYPGIEQVLAEDLRSAKILARLSAIGTALDGKALITEMRHRILEECDYELEARSQRAFATLFAALPGAAVPDVVPHRSSRRVLTSQLDPGRSFGDFVDHAPQSAKDHAGAVIFSTCFRCIFSHCIYNADPHPGNYLLGPDGDVTFLDFGCVRHFDPDMIAIWRRVALATLAGDKAGFRRHYPGLGFVGNADKFDWDHQWAIMQYLYRPFTTNKPFTYTNEYVKESYSVMLFENPNRFRTAMPPEWLFLNRLQWGLNSIFGALGSTARFCDLYREALELPSDPLRIEGHPGLAGD